MYHVTIIVREMAEMEESKFDSSCLMSPEESYVENWLLHQTQNKHKARNLTHFFYCRAEGPTYKDAVAACIEEIEKACEEEGVHAGEVQGLQALRDLSM